MKLYFTRHGKTEWNQEMRLQGMHGDSPLLQESLEEIEKLGRHLKEIPFTKIYSSPLKRAKMTAEGICCELNQQPQIQFASELKELGLGKLEGQRIIDSREKYPKEMWTLRNDPSQYDPTPFNGEVYEDMLARSVGFVQEVVSNTETGPILFVSHGVTLGGCIQTLIGTPLNEVRKQGGLSNNSLTIVDYTDGIFTLDVWNDSSFLN
ncbi:histidine phosphatase family protein [Vagococcus carniphilus]|uniref:histidine phosphatase family protein n=1 Tax=Vagococcus carniphilus TaxID=218144 RepID=UPI00288D4622|nr:histidine phosphatase family protein [Vagococcus carniphilus]MDT2813577.1 histidine phosphatase family protein [Vagococcus carniphilus]MDT2865692.1 histidine phosphatase family protein [Vagococcus carniphilus]